MAELLLELYSEEIPPQLQISARSQVKEFIERSFKEDSIKYKELSIYSSPTRITLVAKDLPLQIKTEVKEIKGPRVDSSDQIIQGFIKAKKVSDKDCFLLDLDGTLLDLKFDHKFWFEHVVLCFSQKEKIEFEDAKNTLSELYKNERGTLKWYCTDYWSQKLGLDLKRITETYMNDIQDFKGTHSFLANLQSMKNQCSGMRFYSVIYFYI